MVKALMVERDAITRHLEEALENWEALMEQLEEVDRAFSEALQDY
jgi:hypothetical protein